METRRHPLVAAMLAAKHKSSTFIAGASPIHDAMMSDRIRALTAVLMADPSAAMQRITDTSCVNQTPVHWAVTSGHTAPLKLLLTVWPAGARVPNSRKKTPMDDARGTETIRLIARALKAA